MCQTYVTALLADGPPSHHAGPAAVEEIIAREGIKQQPVAGERVILKADIVDRHRKSAGRNIARSIGDKATHNRYPDWESRA